VIPGVKHDMLSAAALLSGSDPAFIDVIGPWAAAKARERPEFVFAFAPFWSDVTTFDQLAN